MAMLDTLCAGSCLVGLALLLHKDPSLEQHGAVEPPDTPIVGAANPERAEARPPVLLGRLSPERIRRERELTTKKSLSPRSPHFGSPRPAARSQSPVPQRSISEPAVSAPSLSRYHGEVVEKLLLDTKERSLVYREALVAASKIALLETTVVPLGTKRCSDMSPEECRLMRRLPWARETVEHFNDEVQAKEQRIQSIRAKSNELLHKVRDQEASITRRLAAVRQDPRPDLQGLQAQGLLMAQLTLECEEICHAVLTKRSEQLEAILGTFTKEGVEDSIQNQAATPKADRSLQRHASVASTAALSEVTANMSHLVLGAERHLQHHVSSASTAVSEAEGLPCSL